jgi:hypothetical protein
MTRCSVSRLFRTDSSFVADDFDFSLTDAPPHLLPSHLLPSRQAPHCHGLRCRHPRPHARDRLLGHSFRSNRRNFRALLALPRPRPHPGCNRSWTSLHCMSTRRSLCREHLTDPNFAPFRSLRRRRTPTSSVTRSSAVSESVHVFSKVSLPVSCCPFSRKHPERN